MTYPQGAMANVKGTWPHLSLEGWLSGARDSSGTSWAEVTSGLGMLGGSG